MYHQSSMNLWKAFMFHASYSQELFLLVALHKGVSGYGKFREKSNGRQDTWGKHS